MIKGVGNRLRPGQDQGALAEIVEHQGRQHKKEPGLPDRLGAEMPHVGVERFRAGHRKNHGPHGHQCQPTVLEQKAQAMQRVDRSENARIGHDVRNPQ